MTLPAYVLQLLTNATEPVLPVSWQAGSTPLPPAAGPKRTGDPAAVSLTGKDDAMNAVAYRPEPSARADTDEMREAMFLASKLGIHYCDAVERVRGEMYAREQGPCEVITNYAHRRGE